MDVNQESKLLIEDVERLGLNLPNNYNTKIASMIARKIQDNTPMYTGELNPVWKFYGDVSLNLSNSIFPE